ncbi:MAG: NUDIX hydrolase [Myxococcales bacterium]|nr:NUDIX hydrolase [Myxococcales bacterium]
MHAYAAVVRRSPGSPAEVLLGQKNIYLPPHGRYQFVTIGRSAVQYVLPGGLVRSGEQPIDAAVRELGDLGVKLDPSALSPLCADSVDTFFQVTNPTGVEADAINLAIGEGRTGSLAYNNVRWFQLDAALCALGNKTENHQLPWVSSQLVRSINAGFAREHIGRRANEDHVRYARALAQLLLDVLTPRATPTSPVGPFMMGPS